MSAFDCRYGHVSSDRIAPAREDAAGHHLAKHPPSAANHFSTRARTSRRKAGSAPRGQGANRVAAGEPAVSIRPPS